MTPWTIVPQAPLSMGSHRQEYWSGLLFPSLRGLPHPGIKPTSLALAGGFFSTTAICEAHAVGELIMSGTYRLPPSQS